MTNIGLDQFASSDVILAYSWQGAALTAEHGGPLRLVAHQIYGDASRAAELGRLNALGRQVLVERGDTLNVYAA